uniref:Vacuolar protein sorting protein 25 n=1 Tax=Arundo donax TaxID=35708 RepID=A0A0A8YTG9_ARUDO
MISTNALVRHVLLKLHEAIFKARVKTKAYYSRSLDRRTRENLLLGRLHVSFDFCSNQVSDLSTIELAFPAIHAQAAN